MIYNQKLTTSQKREGAKMHRKQEIERLRSEYMHIYKLKASNVSCGVEAVSGLNQLLTQALNLIAAEIIALEALEWLDGEGKDNE